MACTEAGIEPLGIFNEVLPVANSYRPAAVVAPVSYTHTNFDEVCSHLKKSRYLNAVRKALGSYGVKVFAGAHPFHGGQVIHGKYWFYREGDDSPEEINELYRKSYESMKAGEGTGLIEQGTRLEGAYL